MREKARYVAFEVVPCDDGSFAFDDVFKAVEDAVKLMFGLSGLSEAKLWPMKKDWNGNKGILKVDRSFVEKLKSALPLVKGINGKKVIVKSLKVSGTLKKARLFLKEQKQ